MLAKLGDGIATDAMAKLKAQARLNSVIAFAQRQLDPRLHPYTCTCGTALMPRLRDPKTLELWCCRCGATQDWLAEDKT